MDVSSCTPAVRATLDRIRACAATAALAILIVPLTAPAAQAVVVVSIWPYVSASSFVSNGSNFITYTVYNINGTGPITQIELPEIHAGDINFNYSLPWSGLIPHTGFVQNEYATAQFSTSTIIDGRKPGAYVDLTGDFTSLSTQNGIQVGVNQSFTAPVSTTGLSTQNGIQVGMNQSFTALLTTGVFTEANFTLSNYDSFNLLGSVVIDPPIPDTGITAVPEPASLALIGAGLLAMTGLRRREA